MVRRKEEKGVSIKERGWVKKIKITKKKKEEQTKEEIRKKKEGI